MKAWYAMAQKCEEDYGSYVDYEEGFFVCAKCGEPFTNVIGASLGCEMRTASTSVLSVKRFFNKLIAADKQQKGKQYV